MTSILFDIIRDFCARPENDRVKAMVIWLVIIALIVVTLGFNRISKNGFSDQSTYSEEAKRFNELRQAGEEK